MIRHLLVFAGLAGLVLSATIPAQAAIPLVINHQGLVRVSGTAFTGNGAFRFAFVDSSGNNLWTNDGTNLGGTGTPTNAVSLTVSNGVYSVRLGDTSPPFSMTAIPSTVFDSDNVVLRVWFDDGTNGVQQLSPDQPVTSAAYAFHALKADSATTATTATSATTVTGTLDASQITTGTLDNARLDTSALVLPTGAMMLGATADDSALVAAGYTYTGLVLVVPAWSAKAPMPTARYLLAAATVNGVIYAIGGGYSYSDTLTANEAYDPVTNSWSTKASMPTARQGLAAATVNGVIYAIGGGDYSGVGTILTTVEAYDPATNTWSTKAPMPTARCYPAAATLNGVIYAIGGADNVSLLTTVEAYDPATNTWSYKASMSTGRYGLAAATVNDVIYAIGGLDGVTGRLATNEAYTHMQDISLYVYTKD